MQADDPLRIIFLLAPNYRPEQGVSRESLRDIDGFAERAAARGYEVVRLDSAFFAALRAACDWTSCPSTAIGPPRQMPSPRAVPPRR